jgi:hypothetical protein
MERAKLRIFTDTPPPKIVAQTTLEAEAHSPINSVVAVAVPLGHSRHLDVDGILARSLPKLTESFKKAA